MIDVATNAFEDIFARAMSGDLTRLPESLAQQVTLAFGDAFTAGLALTFVVIGIALAVTAVIIYFGMNKGLKSSFVTRPVGMQDADGVQQ